MVHSFIRYTVVETTFLDICDVEDGTASIIECSLLHCLERYGLDISNLHGFESDGAAVMIGKNNGVATRLKARQPCLLAVHCVNN